MDQPIGAGLTHAQIEEKLRADPPLPGEKDLAGFLTRARLANGTTVNMEPQIASLFAQSVLHYQAGEQWQDGKWTPTGKVIPDPEAGDIRVEHLADGQVIKMTHTPTGLTALAENEDDVWADLQRKVAEHAEES